jgi:hypothetical protein
LFTHNFLRVSKIQRSKMKKLLVGLALTFLMIGLTLTTASAGVDWEDPTLCVDGQWLLVDAAKPSAVTVFVPEDVRFGDQKAGGCKTPGPAAPLIKAVKERDGGHAIKIQVDGKNASMPSVTASYNGVTQTKNNNGKQTLNFKFNLP